MQVYIASHYLIVCDIFSIGNGIILSVYIYRGKMSLLKDMTYQFFFNNTEHQKFNSLIYMIKKSC